MISWKCLLNYQNLVKDLIFPFSYQHHAFWTNLSQKEREEQGWHNRLQPYDPAIVLCASTITSTVTIVPMGQTGLTTMPCWWRVIIKDKTIIVYGCKYVDSSAVSTLMPMTFYDWLKDCHLYITFNKELHSVVIKFKRINWTNSLTVSLI